MPCSQSGRHHTGNACMMMRRVMETCIQKGLAHHNSLASTVCGEQEYYDDLIKACKAWLRVRVQCGRESPHSLVCHGRSRSGRMTSSKHARLGLGFVWMRRRSHPQVWMGPRLLG